MSLMLTVDGSSATTARRKINAKPTGIIDAFLHLAAFKTTDVVSLLRISLLHSPEQQHEHGQC
jgi:hypothetical protein